MEENKTTTILDLFPNFFEKKKSASVYVAFLLNSKDGKVPDETDLTINTSLQSVSTTKENAFGHMVATMSDKDCASILEKVKSGDCFVAYESIIFKKEDLKGIPLVDEGVYEESSDGTFSIKLDGKKFSSDVTVYQITEFNFDLNPDTGKKEVTVLKQEKQA